MEEHFVLGNAAPSSQNLLVETRDAAQGPSAASKPNAALYDMCKGDPEDNTGAHWRERTRKAGEPPIEMYRGKTKPWSCERGGTTMFYERKACNVLPARQASSYLAGKPIIMIGDSITLQRFESMQYLRTFANIRFARVVCVPWEDNTFFESLSRDLELFSTKNAGGILVFNFGLHYNLGCQPTLLGASGCQKFKTTKFHIEDEMKLIIKSLSNSLSNSGGLQQLNNLTSRPSGRKLLKQKNKKRGASQIACYVGQRGLSKALFRHTEKLNMRAYAVDLVHLFKWLQRNRQSLPTNIFWTTTTPQHFLPYGTFTKSNNVNCGNISRSYMEYASWRNTLANALLEEHAPFVRKIDGQVPLLDQHASHVGEQGRDCTHFCTRTGAWNDHMDYFLTTLATMVQ
eukprot:CAMPEP_0197592734 /NCGR_PEP_ID=MMETSP1326-20131121/15507_1 /TAXON_ID=1155430 /ORGANISM="Genus nov. species nov., Strain RCC2288" /LENGTH=399 /DNA_ID=CAMNT_0043158483 /DNA_START=192 /DNA_END=1391 /DNA_ORIENTATION=-